ncbi:MAG: hypothetical protein ACRDTU_07040 [Micromonosporaceae bacterium]
MSRYTLEAPPPKGPPHALGLASGHGLGIWRVMAAQWHDHLPIDTPKGRRCKDPRCRRIWPCWGWRAASDTLDHLHRYPDGGGLVGYDPMPQALLAGEPRLTRVPIQS